DDAATLWTKIFQCLTRGEDQTEDIDTEVPLKLIFGCLFERGELIYASVVHQNIESTKCFLSFGEEVLNIFLLRNIALDRDCLSAFFRNFIYDPLGILLLRCVINHHRRRV